MNAKIVVSLLEIPPLNHRVSHIVSQPVSDPVSMLRSGFREIFLAFIKTLISSALIYTIVPIYILRVRFREVPGDLIDFNSSNNINESRLCPNKWSIEITGKIKSKKVIQESILIWKKCNKYSTKKYTNSVSLFYFLYLSAISMLYFLGDRRESLTILALLKSIKSPGTSRNWTLSI